MTPPPPSLLPRFLASMNITYNMWHDGDGYDLEALAALAPHEKQVAQTILLAHRPQDWRDIEALALLNTPLANQEIENAKHSPDPKIRRQAADHAGPLPDPQRQANLIHAIQTASIGNGLTEAIDEAAAFHPPKVIDALFEGALTRPAEVAVHYAALLFFLHGKSAEPFDWNHRPFFLRFNATTPKERQSAFRDLCQALNINSSRYLK